MPIRIFKKVESDLLSITNAIVSLENPYQKTAEIREMVPCRNLEKIDELCIFVSYVSKFHIKPHVKEHIKSLAKQGISVLLVVNTDDLSTVGEIDHELVDVLVGVYARENMGYDFGAWSHVYSIIEPKLDLKRLYLVNDSLVGPLDLSAFENMIKGIRSNDSEMIGLTSNEDGMWHLQSFFLVFNENILKVPSFKKFFATLWNLPTKELVIFFYELRLTSLVRSMGFKVDAIFKLEGGHFPEHNKTIAYPYELCKIGFPYVKSSLVNDAKLQEKFAKNGFDFSTLL